MENRAFHWGERALVRRRLDEAVAWEHEVSGGTYGAPRIRHALARAGVDVGVRAVATSMRRQGLTGLNRSSPVEWCNRFVSFGLGYAQRFEAGECDGAWKVLPGRPQLFGEDTIPVGTRLPESLVRELDEAAGSLDKLVVSSFVVSYLTACWR